MLPKFQMHDAHVPDGTCLTALPPYRLIANRQRNTWIPHQKKKKRDYNKIPTSLKKNNFGQKTYPHDEAIPGT